MKPSKAVPTIAATVMLAASASGDPAAILLFTAAGCASAPRAADTARASKGDGLESERALPIPADLVRPVEQAARLGRLIYRSTRRRRSGPTCSARACPTIEAVGSPAG
jgi:hypothetical protein